MSPNTPAFHGLSEKELADILEPGRLQKTRSAPAPASSLDFPGETFRVLKDKEEKAFGEYRTRRLVLEARGRMKLGDRI